MFPVLGVQVNDRIVHSFFLPVSFNCLLPIHVDAFYDLFPSISELLTRTYLNIRLKPGDRQMLR